MDVCLHSGRNAAAVMLAFTGGSDLFRRTQARVLEKQQDSLSRVNDTLVKNTAQRTFSVVLGTVI